MTDTAPINRVVDHAAWKAARITFMAREKEFTRQRDELSGARRELPWMEVSNEYLFDGDDGQRSLGDLFDGKNQLIVYHFMFGSGWVEGCPSCSFWADNYDGTEAHLRARDTALVTISRAPLPELQAYKARMGWSFPWLSSVGSEFNFDFGVSFTDEQAEAGDNYNFGTQTFGANEAPGISVFAKSDDGKVFLTYQTFARGLDMLNASYHMLDLTPKGRDEANLDHSMAWLRRHDDYDE
jgi:predicted dithiol-disulfide oxidoreductase (DUF899 family)